MTSEELENLIARLRSPGWATPAELELGERAKELTRDQGIALLRATATPFPWDHEYDDRAGRIILHVVGSDPLPEFVDVLREVMPHLHPRTRPQAVRSLGQIGTVDAVQLMIDTFATYLP